MAPRIHVIINPAAGGQSPILNTLNTVFGEAGAEWDVSLTKENGDGRRFAEEAVAAGADIVAAYGGDGTVADVASGLVGSGVPLGILPGGTANVLSGEFRIPQELGAACALLTGTGRIRTVDVGRVNDHYFLLRVGIGFEAAMVAGADRTLKERLGPLAYGLAALQALREPDVSAYRIKLDDNEIECTGLTCIIANSGNLGAPGLSFAPNVKVDDGLLDVIVVRRADLGTLAALIASAAGLDQVDSPEAEQVVDAEEAMQHWQARQITVEAEPPQTVQVDGELIHPTPVSTEVIPQALRVIVPELEEPARG